MEQQLLALNIEEMDFKKEVLQKMELQDQHFNRTMEKIHDNMVKFTNIIPANICWS